MPTCPTCNRPTLEEATERVREIRRRLDPLLKTDRLASGTDVAVLSLARCLAELLDLLLSTLE